MLEIEFTKEHMYWMDPGKVQIEEMPNQGMALADMCPDNFRFIGARSFSTDKAIFLLILFLKPADNFEQALPGGRFYIDNLLHLDLVSEPVCNPLMAFPSSQTCDNLFVVSVLSNRFEYDVQPVTSLLKVSITGLEAGSSFGGFPVAVLEPNFVATEFLDFSDQIVFVRFDVRFIDAIQLPFVTSAAGARPYTITLQDGNQVSNVRSRWHLDESVGKGHNKPLYLPFALLVCIRCRPSGRHFQELCAVYEIRHRCHLYLVHQRAWSLGRSIRRYDPR